MKPKSILSKSIATLVFAGMTLPSLLRALPLGEQVQAGTASFQRAGSVLSIQTSDRAIINYQSFGIGAGERVSFVQPSANSITLNRVTSANPSYIFGTLQANGHIVLANPYGIFFENGSVVNVGGLIAGAGHISDSDFLAGRINFSSLTGDVENRGRIVSIDDVGLYGAHVSNEGVISSKTGSVTMAAGKSVFVGEAGGNIFVNSSTADIPKARVVSSPKPGVNNSGSIAAPKVLLATGDMYGVAIAQSGAIKSGDITIHAGAGGAVNVSGTLDASNRAAGQRGGKIKVKGDTVAVRNATLDASGDAGGGTITLDGGHNATTPTTVTSSGNIIARGEGGGAKGGTVAMLGDHVGLFENALVDVSGNGGGGAAVIGGNFHGAGPEQNALMTYVSPGSTIRADAVVTGNGGNVAVWSDNATQFFGSISARGGAGSGDGGFVEVSGKHSLDYAGSVNTLAPMGHSGMLLLDPDDATINNTADSNVSVGTPFVANPTAGSAFTVTWNTLNTSLAATPTTVQTSTGSITVAAPSTGSTATELVGNGNLLRLISATTININANITANTTTSPLRFTALGGINLGANITSHNGSVAFDNAVTLTGAAIRTISAGTGGVTFSSTVNGGGAGSLTTNNTGSLSFGGAISNMASLTIQGGPTAVALPTTTVGGFITVTSAGGITQSGVITVGASGSSFTTSTAGQAINLSTSTNIFGANTVAFNTTGAADVAVKADALKFATSVVGGKLTATAVTGGITESGAITTGAGGSSFTASTVGQAINLGTQANSLANTNTVSFSATGATGDVSFRNVGDIVFPLTTVGGKLVAVSDSGNISQTGVLTSGANGNSFTTSTANKTIDFGTLLNGLTGTVSLNTSGAAGDAAIKNGALDFATSVVGGKLTATAVTGALTVEAGGITTEGGAISLTTQKAGGLLTLTGNLDTTNAGGTPAGANVLLRGDALAGAGTVNAGTAGNVQLRPNDPTAVIGVEDGARTFNVTNAILGQITSGGTITIGDATHTGNISVARQNAIARGTENIAVINQGATTADIVITGNNDFTAKNLTLNAGGAITQTAGAGKLNTLNAGNLALTGTKGIGTLALPIVIGAVAGNLSADNQTGATAGDLSLQTGTITIGGAGSTIIERSTGKIQINATNAATDSLTIAGSISAPGVGGAIILNAGAPAGTGTITRTAGILTSETVSLGTTSAMAVGAVGTPIVTATANLNAKSSGGVIVVSNTLAGTTNVQANATNGLVNITNAGGTLSIAAPGVTSSSAGVKIDNTGNLITVGNVVTAGGAGVANLISTGLTNTSTITGPGGVTIDAGTGTLSNAAGTITNGGGVVAAAVTLTADKMVLGATAAAIQGGAGVVTLQQKTNGTAIDLGSTVDTNAPLELSNTELGTVATTGALRVGNASSGAISITAGVTPAVGTVRLTSGAGISGAGLFTGTSLALVAGGAINVNTAVTNLAASTSAGGITVSNTTVGTLNVTTVDTTVAGLSSSGTAISLTETTGAVTLSQAVNAGLSTVTVTLNGLEKLLTNSTTVTATGAGGVTFTADKMALGGTVTATGQTVTLKPNLATNAIAVGATGNATANTLEISNAELGTITATSVVTGSTAVSGLITLGRDEAVAQGTKNLQFITSGNINVAGFDVTGNSVTLGNTSGSPVTNAITNTGAGRLKATANLNLFAINGIGVIPAAPIRIVTVGGTLSAVNTTSGDLFLSTGPITLGDGALGAAISEFNGGNLRIDSTGGIVIGGNVTAGALGTVTLNAIGTITEPAAVVGTVTGATVNLGTSGTTTGIGSAVGPDPVRTNAGTIVALAGAGGVFITELDGANVTVNAAGAGGKIVVNSTSGLLRIVGASGNATAAATDSVTLSSADGVEIANILNAGAGTVAVSANTVDAGNEGFAMTGAGQITTTNTTASAVKILVNTAAAAVNGMGTAALQNITVGNGGTITVNTSQGNATGGSISQAALTLLDAGATGTVALTTGATMAGIGTGAANILTKAGVVTANTGSGGIFITDSVGADVTLNAAGAGGKISFTSMTGLLRVAGASGNATAAAGDSVTLLSASGAIAIDNALNAAGAAVSLTTMGGGNAITQNAAGIITAGTLTLATMDADATLNAATNAITNLGTTTLGMGALGLLDAGGLTVTGVVGAKVGVTLSTSGALAINSAIDAGGGIVRLQNSAGNITQTGAITAGSLLANALAGSVNLGLATNNIATTVAGVASGAGGSFRFQNTGGITVGTVAGDLITTASSGIRTNNGDIAFLTGGALALNQPINAANGAAAPTGASGTVRLQANAGNITQAATGGIVANGLLVNTSAANGGVALTAASATNNVTTIAGHSGTGGFAYQQNGSLTVGPISADGAGLVPFLPIGGLNSIDTTGTLTMTSLGTINFSVPLILLGGLNVTAALIDINNNVPAPTLIQTSGGQTYNGPVVLTANAVLADLIGGAINFTSTVNSDAIATPRALTVNTAGATTFTGAVGNTAPLASVTTDGAGAGTTAINGGQVTTTGGQTYGDAVTLGANTVLKSTPGGSIIFQKTLNGLFSLEADAAVNEVFNGVVGGNAALTNLTTDAILPGGQTQFNMDVALAPAGKAGVNLSGKLTTNDAVLFASANGTTAQPTVRTAGGQDYKSVAANAGMFTQDAILTDSGAKAVTFSGPLNGPRGLTVSTGGATTFSQNIGQITALASLTTDLGGSTILPGLVTTSGSQNYSDKVMLTTATILSSSGSGAINLSSGVIGANQALTLSTGGTATIGASLMNLSAFAPNVSGTTTISGPSTDITVPGPLTFVGPVVIAGNVTITTTSAVPVTTTNGKVNVGPLLTFISSVDGPGNLTVESSGELTFSGGVGQTTPLGTLTAKAPIIDLNSTRTAGNLTAHATVAPTGDGSDGLLRLTGVSYSSQSGSVFFNDPNRTLVSSHATILDQAGSVVISAPFGSFQMGNGQKFLVRFGTLTISVGSQAIVGDLAASAGLTVNAPTIFLQGRPPVSGLFNEHRQDGGLGFVAPRITFGNGGGGLANIAFVTGTTKQATFSTVNSVATVRQINGISVEIDKDQANQFNGNVDVGARNSVTGDPLVANLNLGFIQPIASGVKVTQPGDARIAFVIEFPKRIELAEDTSLSNATLEVLRRLGIEPRLATSDENISISLHEGVFTQPIEGKAEMAEEDYKVVLNRLTKMEAKRIADAYLRLAGDKFEHIAVIATTLAVQVNNFHTEKGPQVTDLTGFAEWLLGRRATDKEADELVKNLDQLAGVFSKLSKVGLTKKEIAICKMKVLGDLGANLPNVKPEDLLLLIDGRAKAPVSALPPGAPSVPASPPPPPETPLPPPPDLTPPPEPAPGGGTQATPSDEPKEAPKTDATSPAAGSIPAPQSGSSEVPKDGPKPDAPPAKN